jgi:hypothetical protein
LPDEQLSQPAHLGSPTFSSECPPIGASWRRLTASCVVRAQKLAARTLVVLLPNHSPRTIELSRISSILDCAVILASEAAKCAGFEPRARTRLCFGEVGPSLGDHSAASRAHAPLPPKPRVVVLVVAVTKVMILSALFSLKEEQDHEEKKKWPLASLSSRLNPRPPTPRTLSTPPFRAGYDAAKPHK